MKNSLFALIALLGILFFSGNLTQAQIKNNCNGTMECRKTEACCTTEGCSTECSNMECNNTESSKMESGAGMSGTKTNELKKDELHKDAVTGETIPDGKAVEFSYLGKTYYFANGENLAKFKAEPIDYAKDLTCPVMGDPATKENSVEYNGTKYYLCCQMCVKKFNKNPEKYTNPKKDN